MPTESVSLDDAAFKGNAAAGVTLLEYTEFQCPYCGAFARETLPQLERDYVATGKIALAVRQFPLEAIHSFALKASLAVGCAGAQDKYWPMFSLLFENQKKLDEPSLRQHAASLGLDVTKFGNCLGAQGLETIRANQASARNLGVTGTPTFFIGLNQREKRVRLVQRLSGAQDYAVFKVALDKWIGEVQRAKK